MRHTFLVVTVKRWLKWVYIYGSYRKIKTGVPLFLDHPVEFDETMQLLLLQLYQVCTIVSGVVYKPAEPLLLQSIGNTFLLRCTDGLHIDGNDRRISAAIYRSVAATDADVIS